MRVTKWTPEYDPKVDVPIVPVWVTFPGLPIHFHQREALFQIGRMLGTPMKLDMATTECLRPSVARLCIELDVSQELPARIFIQAAARCIPQPFVYEDLPKYCNVCSRLGHKSNFCGKEETAGAAQAPSVSPGKKYSKNRGGHPKSLPRQSTLFQTQFMMLPRNIFLRALRI